MFSLSSWHVYASNFSQNEIFKFKWVEKDYCKGDRCRGIGRIGEIENFGYTLGFAGIW